MKTILINNEEVEVDDDSYELLEYMNNNGFITLNSCSGTLKDHPDTKMKYQGYVMLDTNTKAQNMFKKLYDNNYKIYYVISNGKKGIVKNHTFYFYNKDNENTKNILDIAKETSCEKDEENLFNKLDEIIYETDIDKNYNIELELNSYDEETRKDFKINDDEQFIKMWIYRKDEDLEKINELTNNLINKYQLKFAQCEEDVSSDCKQYIIGNKISRTIIIIGKDLEKVIDILLEFKK